MFQVRNYLRVAAVLMAIGLTGCVSTGYRYVDVDGDYYYDERPAYAAPVYVPMYGAVGYGWPGGWYGSAGFGFGTYYGLGGWYGPTWGAFNPRYGYTGYWRPPYYYTPRYSRPAHYYRPPRHQPRAPWPHDSASARRPGEYWSPHGQNRRGDSRTGNRPWRGPGNAVADHQRPQRMTRQPVRTLPARVHVAPPPPAHELPRDMAIQVRPGSAPQRVQRAIPPPSRQAIRPEGREHARVANGPPPRPVNAAPAGPSRRATAPAAVAPRPAPAAPARAAAPQPRPAMQSRPAPAQSRPAARPAPAPRAHPRGSTRTHQRQR